MDWANLLSGAVGGLVGAGGAVATTLITTRSDRAARKDDRNEDRKDHEADRDHQRQTRLLEQGRAAARDSLAITSPFFVRPRVPDEAFRVLSPEEWAQVRRVDDLAELIENEDARVAIRSTIAAIGGASVVEQAVGVIDPSEQTAHAVYYRERRLLRLLRQVLGTYLREEVNALADLRRKAEDAERELDEAFGILEG